MRLIEQSAKWRAFDYDGGPTGAQLAAGAYQSRGGLVPLGCEFEKFSACTAPFLGRTRYQGLRTHPPLSQESIAKAHRIICDLELLKQQGAELLGHDPTTLQVGWAGAGGSSRRSVRALPSWLCALASPCLVRECGRPYGPHTANRCRRSGQGKVVCLAAARLPSLLLLPQQRQLRSSRR